jgi:DNA-binding transcriptional LysR family regulator
MDTNLNPNWFLKARLKTRQLLLLIALDDYRNIHRAADELHMTQPAASKQIKDLEEMLEVRLFERLPRGMEPTIYGETMIRHARMALTSLALAHDDLVTLKSGLSGQVEVGVIMSPAMALLPRAIARIKEQAPLLRIGVQLE